MKKFFYIRASFFNKTYCLFFLIAVFLMGCATQYRYIEPHYLEYYASPDTLHDCSVEITYRYNVFENSSNKKYTRKEKRSGVSLIAVRIANNGEDTLFIPDDLIIESRQTCVFPLEMDEAIDVFIQDHSPIIDELGGATAEVVTINAGWGWLIPIAVSIPSIVNSAVEAKANHNFVNEMLDYYLVYSNVPPGSIVSGLLALPVEPNTPLTFKKK